jgi:hypothetical protein
MNKPLVEKIFKSLYPELDMEIISFEVLPRNQLNEQQEWIEDTPAIFVGVNMKSWPSQAIDVSEKLSLYTGYEFNVFRN